MPVAIMIDLGFERPHIQGSNDDKDLFELCIFQTTYSDHRVHRLGTGPAVETSGMAKLTAHLPLVLEGKIAWSCHVPSVRHRAGLPLSNAYLLTYSLHGAESFLSS